MKGKGKGSEYIVRFMACRGKFSVSKGGIPTWINSGKLLNFYSGEKIVTFEMSKLNMCHA